MNRRRSLRKKIRIMVRFPDEDEVRMGFIKNISHDGAFLEMRSPPAPGSTVRISIHTATGLLETRVKIVWARVYREAARIRSLTAGVGVRFTDRATVDSILSSSPA